MNKLSMMAAIMILGILAPGWVLGQEQSAVVATIASDYSSGAHSIVDVDPVGGPRDVQNSILPTISDISVDAYGDYFYRLERFGAASFHNVTKFAIDAPDTAIWQYSTEGNESGSNPSDMVFVSATKAYLLRYGSNTAWIINPSTTTEAGFKTGELDLSAYADSDGIPEMTGGVIVDGKLFILFQHLDRDNGWSPADNSLVAVIDTAADIELAQITVPVANPQSIQYLAANNTIYVAGVGGYGFAPFGGLATIDPDAYTSSLLIDGQPYGGVPGVAIVSATKGYFIGYGGWQDNTLYTFDPSAGIPAPTVVTGFEGVSLSGMQNGVYIDQNNMLWICNQTDGQIDILDTTTDMVDESIDTTLNPSAVVFVIGDAGDAGDDDDDDEDPFDTCFFDTAE
jgi:hypothetical protein